MKKTLIYITLVILNCSFIASRNNLSKPSKVASGIAAKDSAAAGFCGVQSDVRFYFLNEGLYEFSVADANTGTAKYSVCIEGTGASGRCREDNFNVPWRFYTDKDLSISVWRSVRRKVKDENGKVHSVYSAPEETTIVKTGGDKNWKSWKGNKLSWQQTDSAGKVVFKININVKKIK